ncbi:MAG: enoyl-CoA hydratase/isomerase family protein [Chitinophagaceae bacterium]|nr:enoyl-CoA hydratase/isomerase family protein [Chitinophagaceae bacterium]
MHVVLYEAEDGIARITLNRPEKFNALNREMATRIQEALQRAENDQSVRCIVLTGKGKAFSAGQDLSELNGPLTEEIKRILPEQLNPIVMKLRTISKPVVAAVNGIAAGAAANIALCCDIVMAAESATFIQAFSKIGLIPDSGGTYMLPRLIGLQRATALMMTAESVSATDAARMGMIYKAVPDAQLIFESETLARKLAKMPTKALYLTRRALDESLGAGSFEEQLSNEEKWQGEAAATSDFSEGIRAFLEKRPAIFKGE